jgi:hypothetical protein
LLEEAEKTHRGADRGSQFSYKPFGTEMGKTGWEKAVEVKLADKMSNDRKKMQVVNGKIRIRRKQGGIATV